MKRDRGVTLVELMVALAVLGIVLGLGVPAWSDIVRTNRLVTATNRLVGAIHLARAEAVRSGLRVTLCASRDGSECTAEGYEQGWIVFHDLDGDTYKDAAEPVVHSGAPAQGVTMRGNRSVSRMISYTPLGLPKTAGGAFQAGAILVCGQGEGRKLILSRAGRLRIERSVCP